MRAWPRPRSRCTCCRMADDDERSGNGGGLVPTRPSDGVASRAVLQLGSGTRSPFDHVGLGARALPFALVAILATASISLPPGPSSPPEALGAIGLLALITVAFLLPW